MKFAKPKPNSGKRKPQNTQVVKCPICKKDNLVYCWSFGGSGKKCQGCNFLMTRKNVNQCVASLEIDLSLPPNTFKV